MSAYLIYLTLKTMFEIISKNISINHVCIKMTKFVRNSEHIRYNRRRKLIAKYFEQLNKIYKNDEIRKRDFL